MSGDTFDRILVARHNPKNACMAVNDEWLCVAPVEAWPVKESTHWFIGASTKQMSRYGWVHQLSNPLTLSDFMLSLEGEANGVAFEESQLSLLRAVQRLDVGLPVAVDFVSRGIEQKKIHLLVHRVIFHRQEHN